MSDSTTTTIVADEHVPGGFLGHPRGLATLFFTEMFERFSFYGMRSLLLVFLIAPAVKGGLGLSDARAGAIYGLYAGGAYLMCLPGGWIADRLLGQRRSVFWGGVLISVGNLLLSVPTGLPLVYLSLLLVALGTGLLKTNASTLVGELYKGDSSSRRDSAFSIYYFGINIGALSPLIAGTVGEVIGYRWCFFTAGIAMVIGLVQYQWTQHWLGDSGVAPAPATSAERLRSRRLLTAGLVVLAVLVAATALNLLPLDVVQVASVSQWLGALVAVLFFGAIIAFGGLTAIERKRVAVIALFFVCAALFWAGYEQAGSTLTLFAQDQTDRSFLGSWFPSGEHPVSWYQLPQSVFVLTFAPVFAWVWLTLGKRDRDPPAAAKLGYGFLQMGASFVVMMLAAKLVLATGHKVSPSWLIVTYLLQTTGELCLSPIGLSNVTKLAPAKFASQLMGTWFLGAAIGNLAAGRIGGEIGSNVSVMPTQFLVMALIGGAAAVLLFLVAKPVTAWMGGIK